MSSPQIEPFQDASPHHSAFIGEVIADHSYVEFLLTPTSFHVLHHGGLSVKDFLDHGVVPTVIQARVFFWILAQMLKTILFERFEIIIHLGGCTEIVYFLIFISVMFQQDLACKDSLAAPRRT